MDRRQDIFDRFTRNIDLMGESAPGQTLVEIGGYRRVLIEHHCGVKEYCRERIGIKVNFGMIMVCGSCLELTRMSKEQLVISGKIDCVSLMRRGK